MGRAVSISGIAALTGHGRGLEALVGVHHKRTTLGELPLREVLKERAPRRLDRLSEIAVIAGAEALLDAGGTLEPLVGAASERAGVFFATSYGNLAGTIAFLQKLHDKGPRFASPLDFPNLVLSAPTGTLSIQFGMRGELLAFNQNELCGVQALCAAYEALSSGRLDIALCAAAEEKSVARDACSPVPGLDMGEGGGAVVLEAGQGPVMLGGVGLAGGANALADACLQASRGATADVVIGGAAAGGAFDLAARIGFIDGHGVIDTAYAAHLIRTKRARTALIYGSEPGNAAALWLESHP